MMTFNKHTQLGDTDLFNAEGYAKERQAINKKAFNRAHQENTTNLPDLVVDQRSIMNEMAWFKMNGREYDPVQSLDRIKAPDDIIPTAIGPMDADIKSTPWETGWLAYKGKPPRQNPQVYEVYILIIDHHPDYHFRGWMWGCKLLEKENWDRNTRIRPSKAFAMPQNELFQNHPAFIMFKPPPEEWANLKPEGYG